MIYIIYILYKQCLLNIPQSESTFNIQDDERWDNNLGAERICKQLGYHKGVRGPRKTNPGGSGPVHALSHVPHVLSRCPHTIDQSVICSGGLGPGHGMETKEIRGEMEKRKAKEKLVQKPVQLTSAARGCRKCVDQCHSRKLQRCRIFKCDTSRAMCEVYCKQEKECK